MRSFHCPTPHCKTTSKEITKRGYFITKWNAQPVARYRCTLCGRSFSTHTFRKTFGQKRPDLNDPIFRYYCSGISQRRLARVLGVNRKTVVRKFLFLAALAKDAHENWIEASQVDTAQFDEMESFEHTRLKPLSIAIAVEEKERKLLVAELARMPAKGKLSSVALRKYGYRKDERPKMRKRALKRLAELSPSFIKTDGHPGYPVPIRKWLAEARHIALDTRSANTFRPEGSRRNLNDPLFALNHTAAKIRHDLSRMMRRVWVTTKKPSRLKAHLDLYIAYHNGYELSP